MAPKQMAEINTEAIVSSGDETSTSLTVVQPLQLTQTVEEPPIDPENVIVEEVAPISDVLPVSEQSGITLNMTQEQLDPWNPDTTPEEMKNAFDILTTEEKSFVLSAIREAYETMKSRLTLLCPDETIEPKGKGKTKRERFENLPITVYVWFKGVRYEITLKSNDRVGTLRQHLASKAGLPLRSKFIFNKEGGFLKPNFNSITYLYTLGVGNGTVINALEQPSQAAAAKPAPAPAMALAMPLGGQQNDNDEETEEEVANDEDDVSDGEDDEQ